jgi:hypothetical protein
MTNMPTFITFASWEDRFAEGSQRILQEHTPQKVLMYFFDTYAGMSRENREKVFELCKVSQVKLLEYELQVIDPATSWKTLRDTVLENVPEKSEIIVDFSTMPREVIWTVFWLLDLRQATIHYVYHRPQDYGDWLSRDPQRPRLVYKMSGLSKLGARTALIVLPGYDLDRVEQLISFFEPAVTLLGLQEQTWDEKSTERTKRHVERFASDSTVTKFSVNAFAEDCGQAVVEAQVKPYLDTHNVIMSSLGPKLSAVSLYRLHRRYPETGLAYAPSREFNREYSIGIGEAIKGTI